MDEPRWDLLPRHPRRFFGLAEDFDRRALKRAYRDLVKRYKPDKSPEEFQKIRAAYEHLTDRLAGKAHAPPRADVPVSEASPAALELASSPSREVDRQEKWPSPTPPPTEPPEQLRELARSGSAWNVFVQAQPLWQRLAKEYPFAVNAEVLRDCTTALDSVALDAKASQARTLAVLGMVRRMLFKAQPSWLDEQLTFLEEHHLDLPENFRDRIDLLEDLAGYAKVREENVREPVHRALDAMILAYAELEPAEFRLFIEQRATDLVAEPDAFHEGLPIAASGPEDPLFRAAETLHRLITHLGLVRRAEMEGRSAEAASLPEAVPRLVEELERETLEDFERHPTKLVKTVRFDTYVARLFFSSLLALLFLPVLKIIYWEEFGTSTGSWVVYGEYLMFFVAGLLWLGSFLPPVIDYSFRGHLRNQTQEKTWPFYGGLWRPWVFRFLAESRTPLLPLLKELSPLVQAGYPWVALWLFEPLKQDLGAWLFADLACLAR